ncbi:MAG: LTA synthase family protein [Betaproteobacteria bacterium]
MFDNMNSYFGANSYNIVDRTDFDDKSIASANIWGVADESLFKHSIEVLDRAFAAGTPFFAHIMTTSNHRPFTYPDGRIDIPSPGGREGGVKYTDYAIGKFIEDSRGKPWFADTLFIFTADHCAAVAGKTRLPVANYRIPLIMYGPTLVAPEVISRIASQIDVPPTIMDMLGFAGSDRFFGEDLFGIPSQRAFISNYQELGYYKDNVLTVLGPEQKVAAYSVDPVTLASVPRALDAQLLREAIAYYQTSARAFASGDLALSPARSKAQTIAH